MKRIILILAAVASMLLAGASPAVAGDEKVTLCHNGNTITIAWEAAYGESGHFIPVTNAPRVGHETDTLGECPVPEPTPTPTPYVDPNDCTGDCATPTPSPSPTVAPSTSPTPSVAPSPSERPTAKPTTPPTDTVADTGGTGGGGLAPVLLLLAAVSAGSLLLTRKRT